VDVTLLCAREINTGLHSRGRRVHWMGFRRRELHKRQAEESAEQDVFDDEPDWEGGRARERKGLRWNKTSKSGLDAMVSAVRRSAAEMGKHRVGSGEN
jgi:hypothetical protein